MKLNRTCTTSASIGCDSAAAGDVIADHYYLTGRTCSNRGINIAGVDNIGTRAQGETAIVMYYDAGGFIHPALFTALEKISSLTLALSNTRPPSGINFAAVNHGGINTQLIL